MKTLIYFIICTISVIVINTVTLAQDTITQPVLTIDLKEVVVKPFIESRPDGHAPAGVMAGHIHKKGVWMMSYRYMLMNMAGNRNGSNDISDEVIFHDYMVAPQTMDMQMHTLGIMYGVNSRITLMTMFSYLDKKMALKTKMGMDFTTHTSGVGDIVPSILYNLTESNKEKIIFNAGLRIPIGNIEQKGNTPVGENQKLPYPMQLGSGTYDIFYKLTYIGQRERISWGVQGNTIIRTGYNVLDYRLGDVSQLSTWMSYRLSNSLSASFRLVGEKTEKNVGKDADMIPVMAPTANAKNTGVEILIAHTGLNFYVHKGKLKGSRWNLEYGFPVYQNMREIQMPMRTNITLTFEWQTSQ